MFSSIDDQLRPEIRRVHEYAVSAVDSLDGLHDHTFWLESDLSEDKKLLPLYTLMGRKYRYGPKVDKALRNIAKEYIALREACVSGRKLYNAVAPEFILSSQDIEKGTGVIAESIHDAVFRIGERQLAAIDYDVPDEWKLPDTLTLDDLFDWLVESESPKWIADAVPGLSFGEGNRLVVQLRREALSASQIRRRESGPIVAGAEGGTTNSGEPGKNNATQRSPEPRVQVKVETFIVIVDARPYRIEGSKQVAQRVAQFMEALVRADGEVVSMTDFQVRTRNMENQCSDIKDLVERQPGGGCRIPREKLWLNKVNSWHLISQAMSSIH